MWQAEKRGQDHTVSKLSELLRQPGLFNSKQEQGAAGAWGERSYSAPSTEENLELGGVGKAGEVRRARVQRGEGLSERAGHQVEPSGGHCLW